MGGAHALWKKGETLFDYWVPHLVYISQSLSKRETKNDDLFLLGYQFLSYTPVFLETRRPLQITIKASVTESFEWASMGAGNWTQSSGSAATAFNQWATPLAPSPHLSFISRQKSQLASAYQVWK